jgi:hypothetical protein
MRDQKSQESKEDSKEESKEVRGGFMAIYHEIEEISYGPLIGLPAISRVFLCIRHKLLRDGLGQKPIGHSFVMEKTGLTKAQVVNSAKKLQSYGVILIRADTKVTPNGRIQHFENTYELNPALFGEDYNWYKNNPTVRVYSNEKVGSYSRKGISPSGIKSDTRGSIESDTRVVPNLIPGNEPKMSELLEKIFPKNPSSNNPKSNNPSCEEIDFSGKRSGSGITPGRKRTQQEHEEIIRAQVAQMKAGKL